MSAGFLTTKVFQLLRSNSSEPKPELSQLASEIRLTLKWLGYEVVEKSVEEKKSRRGIRRGLGGGAGRKPDRPPKGFLQE